MVLMEMKVKLVPQDPLAHQELMLLPRLQSMDLQVQEDPQEVQEHEAHRDLLVSKGKVVHLAQEDLQDHKVHKDHQGLMVQMVLME